MGWLIALGVAALLAILPLGASVKYNAEGVLVRVIAGPLKIKVYPLAKKEKKADPKAEEKKARAEARKKADKEAKKQAQKAAKEKTASEKAMVPILPEEKGGSLLDFLPLVRLGLEFLGTFRRKLRVNMLQLKLIMAADDPCDLAVNYGRAWTALGNLMPQLERLFVIKKRDVEVECDFCDSETKVVARLDLTITLGRFLALLVVYAVRALVKYMKITHSRKGGAKQ